MQKWYCYFEICGLVSVSFIKLAIHLPYNPEVTCIQMFVAAFFLVSPQTDNLDVYQLTNTMAPNYEKEVPTLGLYE